MLNLQPSRFSHDVYLPHYNNDNTQLIHDLPLTESKISQTELTTLAEKTNRQLRLRELLLANSSQARLVVMSLPMPRKVRTS